MADKKHINIGIDADLHTQLKIASAANGTTITNYVIDSIKEKLQRDAEKEN